MSSFKSNRTKPNAKLLVKLATLLTLRHRLKRLHYVRVVEFTNMRRDYKYLKITVIINEWTYFILTNWGSRLWALTSTCKGLIWSLTHINLQPIFSTKSTNYPSTSLTWLTWYIQSIIFYSAPKKCSLTLKCGQKWSG